MDDATELEDKLRRAQENLRTMEEAEQELKEEEATLLKRLQKRVLSQTNTEKFISDQIMEKVGIVTQLEKELDDMRSTQLSKKARHRKTVEKGRALHDEAVRILKAEINKREESLLKDAKKKAMRNTLMAQQAHLLEQQNLSRSAASTAFQEYEDMRMREITRLTGKERLKNQGKIQIYKEQLERMNNQAGTKAQMDYDENMAKIQKVGQATINTLDLNERLAREHQEFKRELEIHRYTVREAQDQNRRLQAVLESTVQQFWESEKRLETKQHRALKSREYEQHDIQRVQADLEKCQQDAQACRKALREVLKESEDLKAENQSVKDEAGEMFNGNSISWAITTALPAIWNGSKSNSRPDNSKAAKNEEELELLLSALRVALIHEEFTHALGSASKDKRPEVSTQVSSEYSMSTVVPQ